MYFSSARAAVVVVPGLAAATSPTPRPGFTIIEYCCDPFFFLLCFFRFLVGVVLRSSLSSLSAVSVSNAERRSGISDEALQHRTKLAIGIRCSHWPTVSTRNNESLRRSRPRFRMPPSAVITSTLMNLRFRQLKESDAGKMLEFHRSNLIVPARLEYMKVCRRSSFQAFLKHHIPESEHSCHLAAFQGLTIHPNWSFGAFEAKTNVLVASILTERLSPQYTKVEKAEKRNFTYVSQLAVASQYRNQGIAKILLGALENSKLYPLASRTTNVFLHVMVENMAALRLYRNCGFLPTAFIPDMYDSAGGTDGFEMIKSISSPGDEEPEKASSWQDCCGLFGRLQS